MVNTGAPALAGHVASIAGNLRGGERKQTVNLGREILGTSGGVDVHHGLTLV